MNHKSYERSSKICTLHTFIFIKEYFSEKTNNVKRTQMIEPTRSNNKWMNRFSMTLLYCWFYCVLPIPWTRLKSRTSPLIKRNLVFVAKIKWRLLYIKIFIIKLIHKLQIQRNIVPKVMVNYFWIDLGLELNALSHWIVGLPQPTKIIAQTFWLINA